MGGVVPKGQDNDELVDNLIEAKYLFNPKICRIFRRVDRGDFYPGEFHEDAYRDQAIRSGNIHLSAPCIYCSVMENMDFKPGLSFMNVGSGTGYLSTLVGQILGPHDTNHGVEYYEDAIEYAKSKIEQFMKYSEGFNVLKFCKPQLVQGNVHCLDIVFRKYDRVYVGARLLDENTKQNIKELVEIGGILIFPTGENLTKFTKISETDWEEKTLLNVQFSDLIGKQPQDKEALRIYTQPWKLKDIARQVILDNVFPSRDSVPTMTDLEVLNDLPLPTVLIRYLKYFRDPDQQKPIDPNRISQRFSSEEYSDDSDEGGGGGMGRGLEVVFDDNDDDGDEDGDGDGAGDGAGGNRRRIRFRIVLR